ncbi:MAG: hypothetical protein IIT65_07840 [Lachnospiraceae bacterium]|nr:hypothetical protein [Lachnospiraceae bacterium]
MANASSYATKSQLILIMGDAATKTAAALADKVDKVAGASGDRATISYTDTSSANYGVEIKAEKNTTAQETTVHNESKLDVDNNSIGMMSVQSGTSGNTLAQVRLQDGKAYYQKTSSSTFPAIVDGDEIVNKTFLGTNHYTKTEVNSIVNAASFGGFKIVDSLPDVSLADSKSIYLVPKTGTETNNIYFEYICVTEVNPLDQSETKYWEKIGDTEIDLTDYALKSELPTDLSSSDVDDIIAAFDLT